MSGTSLDKRGNTYSCGQCEKDGLTPEFNYCPFCGLEIILRFDLDSDCALHFTKQTSHTNNMMTPFNKC